MKESWNWGSWLYKSRTTSPAESKQKAFKITAEVTTVKWASIPRQRLSSAVLCLMGEAFIGSFVFCWEDQEINTDVQLEYGLSWLLSSTDFKNLKWHLFSARESEWSINTCSFCRVAKEKFSWSWSVIFRHIYCISDNWRWIKANTVDVFFYSVDVRL